MIRSTVLALFSLLFLASTTDAIIQPTPVPLEVLLPGNSLIATPEALLIARGLRQRVIAQGSCNPNLCFALDGSGSISEADFTSQKDFVQLVAAIVGVDTDAAFAAVQYGLRNIGISSLTNDVDQFLLDVDASELEGAPRTFVAAGLGFCINELRPRTEDANKIVLLGDGRSNFGGNPVPIAKTFREPTGDGAICAVAVGFTDLSVLNGITGSSTRVLNIDGYFELLDILDQVVTEICEFADDATPAPVAVF